MTGPIRRRRVRPGARPPAGIEHHCAPLGGAAWIGGSLGIHSCRRVFEPFVRARMKDESRARMSKVEGMTHDAIEHFFARQQDAWDARDPDALARCHAQDGTIVSPIFRNVVGRRGILESYLSLFTIFPDWHYRPESLLIDGNRAAQPFSADATHVGDFMGIAGSGRKFTIEGVRLFDMAEGLIARERRFYDFTGLLIQLGILRGKPARPEAI